MKRTGRCCGAGSVAEVVVVESLSVKSVMRLAVVRGARRRCCDGLVRQLCDWVKMGYRSGRDLAGMAPGTEASSWLRTFLRLYMYLGVR